jgi:hypothetical protein
MTMNAGSESEQNSHEAKRRRWLLGLEPIFEGGWLHKGRRAAAWDVEDKLTAVSLLGDVTVDLCNAKSTPSVVDLYAYAVGRDVDVIVPDGTHVELSGRRHNDHLINDSASVPEDQRHSVVRIVGRTLLGDVTVRVGGGAN